MVAKRGQIWTLLRGGSQHRVLVISNDEYNAIPEAAIELIDAGVFSGGDAHLTTSLLGTRRLYEYAADPRNGIRVEPVSLTHAPATLMDVGPRKVVKKAAAGRKG